MRKTPKEIKNNSFFSEQDGKQNEERLKNDEKSNMIRKGFSKYTKMV